MRQLMVRDVMTADPVTVTPATPLKELAGLLVEQRVSALPVLSLRGKVIGIVSQTHLLRKEEIRRPPEVWHPRPPWRRRRDLTAETVGQVMTPDPVTVSPDATVAQAARLMDRHRIGCLPVVDDDGKLFGMVRPADLLRIFLRPDEEIRAAVIDEVLRRYLGTNPATVTVRVEDGVVTLSGEVGYKSMMPLVLPVVRTVDGVIDVIATDLTYATDDTGMPVVPDVPDYLPTPRTT